MCASDGDFNNIIDLINTFDTGLLSNKDNIELDTLLSFRLMESVLINPFLEDYLVSSSQKRIVKEKVAMIKYYSGTTLIDGNNKIQSDFESGYQLLIESASMGNEFASELIMDIINEKMNQNLDIIGNAVHTKINSLGDIDSLVSKLHNAVLASVDLLKALPISRESTMRNYLFGQYEEVYDKLYEMIKALAKAYSCFTLVPPCIDHWLSAYESWRI